MAVFLVCEIGERVTIEFDAFNESLILSDWYTYPIEMRRIFALVLSNAQKPVIVRGFGNTFCVREYFRLVIVWFFVQIKNQTIGQIHFFSILFYALDTSKKLLLFYDTSSDKLGILMKHLIVVIAIVKYTFVMMMHMFVT